MAQITADLVYARLAPGVLDELRRLNPKDENGHRKNRHHQWLTPDVGHPVLRDHITGLIYLGKVFDSWDGFYVAVNKAMPKYGEYADITFPRSRLNLFPSGACGLSRNRSALFRREFFGSRLPALHPAKSAKGNGGWILPGVRIFQRRSVHLLADGLLDDAAGDSHKIMIFGFSA